MHNVCIEHCTCLLASGMYLYRMTACKSCSYAHDQTFAHCTFLDPIPPLQLLVVIIVSIWWTDQLGERWQDKPRPTRTKTNQDDNCPPAGNGRGHKTCSRPPDFSALKVSTLVIKEVGALSFVCFFFMIFGFVCWSRFGSQPFIVGKVYFFQKNTAFLTCSESLADFTHGDRPPIIIPFIYIVRRCCQAFLAVPLAQSVNCCLLSIL